MILIQKNDFFEIQTSSDMDFLFAAPATAPHVSDVIKQIDKTALRNVLPQNIQWDAFAKLPTQRFPMYVYQTKSMAHFGYFVDLLVRCILYKEFPSLCDLSCLAESAELPLFLSISDGKDWRTLIPEMVEQTIIPGDSSLPSDMPPNQKGWSLFNKFVTDIRKTFSNLASTPNEKLIFGQEIRLSSSEGLNIQGHPDLPWNNGVLDIKTISKPSTNAEVHVAQVATYAAINRELGKKMNYVGLYYTLQPNPLVFFNIENWDHKPLLQLLRITIQRMQDPEVQLAELMIQGLDISTRQKNKAVKMMHSLKTNSLSAVSESPEVRRFREYFATHDLPPKMGHHVHGCSQVEESIRTYSGYPIQFYFTPQTGKFPDYDLPKLKTLLRDRNLLPAFIHAPCWMNISNPPTKRVTDPIASLNVFVRELQMGAEMGLSGVVYHAGRNKKDLGISDKEATTRMLQYTLWCVCNASLSCPFLLETPVGKGSELLWHVEDFVAFYKEVISNYVLYYTHFHRRAPTTECPFGLCIDTAHIWGAGYNPRDYFNAFTKELSPNTIKLVHFNDSNQQRGSRTDGHMIPGSGNIPLADLEWVYQFCIQHNIPMVRE